MDKNITNTQKDKHLIDLPFLCFRDLGLLGEFWFCKKKIIQIRLNSLYILKHIIHTINTNTVCKRGNKCIKYLIWLSLFGCDMEIRSLFIMWKQSGVLLYYSLSTVKIKGKLFLNAHLFFLHHTTSHYHWGHRCLPDHSLICSCYCWWLVC